MFHEAQEVVREKMVYRATVAGLLPAQWQLVERGIWLSATPAKYILPAQGFKLHVSATHETAVETLRRVVPACVEMQVPFKCAGSPARLEMLLSKRASRGSSGKFITVYPSEHEVLLETAARIHEHTRGMEGPYILSDSRYPNSKVLHYRYGAFIERTLLQCDGTRIPALASPDGSLVPDERQAWFSLPSWIRAPFGEAVEDQEAADGKLLGGRFDVTGAISFSNCGGVYRASDTFTGETVVLKEARPYVGLLPVGNATIDAVYRLQREYRNLARLGSLNLCPRPISLFQDWEHWYLAQETARGQPISMFRAREDVVIAPYLGVLHDRLPDSLRHFACVALALITALQRVQNTGVIFGDLSANNVFYDELSKEVQFIDVESAMILGEPDEMTNFAAAWGTPGYISPKRRNTGRLEKEDDWFAAGALLRGFLLPVEQLNELESEAGNRLLERMVAHGLPRLVIEIIDAVSSAQVDRAIALCDQALSQR